VKRFLNAFTLRKKLAKVARLENIKDEVLVKLMILEYTNDELFLELFKLQARQAGFPVELAGLEKAVAEGTGYDEAAKALKGAWLGNGVKAWVALAPALSGTDLRDYFWIARDKLDATFSGLSMISPVTRAVLNDLLAGTAPQRIAGIESAAKLSQQELASLFGFLEQAIMRKPEEKNAYDVIRTLTEKNLPGAAEKFNEILTAVPLNLANPAVGLDVQLLLTRRPDLRPIFTSAQERLEKSKDRIGAAMQSSNKGRKN
jgi:hypothetical protein